MSVSLRNIEVAYGDRDTIELEVERESVIHHFELPPEIRVPAIDVKRALDEPLDFPPVSQAIVPGDKITIAVDGNVPLIGPILDGLWSQFEKREITPPDVTIVHGQSVSGGDPRVFARNPACREFRYVVHNAGEENRCHYLATTTKGDRVYLAKELTDADFMLSVGCMGNDERLGFAGTNSVFYPNMSTQEEIDRQIGRGHTELTPTDDRPLRSLVDEIGWLLGVQFTVQVIPGRRGGASRILAGCNETVFNRGRELIESQLWLGIEERPEAVLVAVDAVNGQTCWSDVVDAIHTGRRLVERDGRIIVISNVEEAIPDAFKPILTSDFPNDAAQAVWSPKSVDSPVAAKLLDAVEWARVYLLSGRPAEEVEDLFMIPLASHSEVQKLLQTTRECAFVESASRVYARIDS